MLTRLARQTGAAVLLLACLIGPAHAGAAGEGATTSSSSTTTTSVDAGTVDAGRIYRGTVTVSGAVSASIQYVWGRLTASSAVLDQLAPALGGNAQTALSFYRNAIGTLPSNYELLTATAANPANFLYYDGSRSGFEYPTSITDGADALGIENRVIGGRTQQWSSTVSGPSNYAYAITATKTDVSTSTQNIMAGDVVLATHTHTLTEIKNYSGTANVSVYEVQGSKYVSPIVLDVRGHGRLEASNGNWLPHPGKLTRDRLVAFDVNANGFEELMEWVGPNDGLLVEPKADGSLDGSCLFGTTGGWTSGYEKLSLRDANHDERLSGAELDGLSIWQDRNGNARPDLGEVRGLKEYKITELGLMHTNYRSTFTMNGSRHVMWDWWPSALHVRKIEVASLLKP